MREGGQVQEIIEAKERVAKMERLLIRYGGWLAGVALAVALLTGCASVQTGAAAKEGGKPAVTEEAKLEGNNFWKDDEVIMKFGERDLSYADMKKEFLKWAKPGVELTAMSKENQVKFFNKFFYQKLFAAEAKARGLDATQNYLDHTLAKRYRILVDVYKRHEIVEKAIPSEEYLMQWIPPAEDEVIVQVIVKRDMAEARRVYEQARAGEDFEALWRKENEGLQREGAGMSPWLSLHNSQKYPPPVVERFLNAEIGTLLEPFYMDIGFLVVKVARKRTGEELRKSELESRRGQLVDDYQTNYYQEQGKRLKEKAEIVYHNEVVDSFVKGDGKPSSIIVEVDGVKFPASEAIEEMVESEHGGQPIIQRLNKFVESVLIGREAIRLGLDKHPDFLERWADEEDRALSRELSRVTVASAESTPVTDQELLEFVKANPDKFLLPESRKIYVIMTSDKGKAESVVERLGKGEDFGKLAAEVSEMPESVTRGGELGWSEQRDLPQPFQEPLFKLADGEYTKEPIETTSAQQTPVWFIFKVAGVQKPAPAPLERVNLRSAEPKVMAERRTKSLVLLASDISAKYGYKICIDTKAE